MRGLFEHNRWAVEVGYRLVGGKHMGKGWMKSGKELNVEEGK